MNDEDRLTMMYKAWASDSQMKDVDFLGLVMKEFSCTRGQAIQRSRRALGEEVTIIRLTEHVREDIAGGR